MDKNKELLEQLKYLRLQSFVDYLEETEAEDKSLRESLLTLCRYESERRYALSVQRKIKQAGFPKTKTLAMLDFDKAPKLPKETVKNLSTCKFIEDKKNVILVGDSGGGKTHLAIALGVEACKKVFSVGFY
ncbi:MAG: ATP-binding protein, partial [Bdellovibrionales bacterium]|nr:ATP-binding protein [Bdellovibrionales bacterium]